MANLTDRVARIHEALADSIDNTKPMLIFDGPFQLLISVILSAQTTDEQVNGVTPELFKRYPTPEKLAAAEVADVERIVHSTGFFRSKARNIRAAAGAIDDRFDGCVPDTIEELVEIPGVGRKSANVIVGAIYGQPAIIVDTHFKRVTTRLGLTTAESPEKIERELRAIVPSDMQYEFSMLVNRHGRITCRARTPQCDSCVLYDLCPWPAEHA